MGMERGTATLETSLAVSLKVTFQSHHSRGASPSNSKSTARRKESMRLYKAGTQVFIAAVFVIAPNWKQSSVFQGRNG